MKRILWIAWLGLVGCQLKHPKPVDYSAILQCRMGCTTLVETEHTTLTGTQKRALHRFLGHQGHQPILLSPCQGKASKRLMAAVQAELKALGRDVQVTKPTLPMHTPEHACINLVAGALTVHPPKCPPLNMKTAHRNHMGCHSAQWHIKTIANPYDLLMKRGDQ